MANKVRLCLLLSECRSNTLGEILNRNKTKTVGFEIFLDPRLNNPIKLLKNDFECERRGREAGVRTSNPDVLGLILRVPNFLRKQFDVG